MLKIHILGGPGSGKTTLGECLSSRFHVPHYDLDQIGWKLNDMAEYIDTAFALAKQPGWVTENIGVIWTDPLLYQADCIMQCICKVMLGERASIQHVAPCRHWRTDVTTE